MHLPSGLAGLVSLLSLSRRDDFSFEPDSHPYEDALTGLKFASYASDRGVTYRVAIPAVIPASAEFDTVLQVVAPITIGWAGFAWGGTMTYNPLAIMWANGTNNVVVSPRIAYGYYTPPIYEPTTYKVLEKASFINATHFQVTTTCKGCTKWGDDDMGYTEVDVSQDVTFGYAFSSNPVDAPEDSESSFAIHDGVGHPIFDLSVAKNDDFEAKVAAALV